MKYLLAGWKGKPLVVFESKGDKVYIIWEDNLQLEKEVCKETSFGSIEMVVFVAKEDWRCDVIKEFDSIDELESLLVMLELTR